MELARRHTETKQETQEPPRTPNKVLEGRADDSTGMMNDTRYCCGIRSVIFAEHMNDTVNEPLVDIACISLQSGTPNKDNLNCSKATADEG